MDAGHQAAFICSHVFEGREPILYVCRTDGEFQFLCGSVHEESELPRVAGLDCIVERDASLFELLDLPDDWQAERNDVKAPWIRSHIE